MSPASIIEARERRGLLWHVLVPVALLVLLVAAIDGLLVQRVAITLEHKALTSQSLSVASVVKRFRLKLEATTGDYTWWDEFYGQVGAPSFGEWQKINLGDTLSQSFEATQAWVVSPRGEVLYAWRADHAGPEVRFADSPALEGLRQAALARPDIDGPHAVSAFAMIGGKLHIAAAGLLSPTDPTLRDAADRTHNVFIVVSDIAAFAYPKLAEDFALSGLTFSPAPPAEGAPAIPLADAGGLPLGFLTWKVDSQIGAFWANYWPWGAALLVGIAAALILLARRWQGLIARFVSVSLTAKAAQEASAAKSAFIANMSHELRTPLNAIIGFGEILATELYGPHTEPKYREYANDIRASGVHLLELINDILFVARIEAGQYRVDIEECHLDEIAADSVRMLAQKAFKGGVALAIDSERSGLAVLADPAALRQIFINLLSNAVKFTPAGGRVTLSWRERRLDRSVEIVLSDSGIGIAPDKLPLLGTPFFQVADVHARNAGGAGLGLSIVNGLVLAMKGTVSIESDLGRGTIVTVRLPAARRAAAQMQAA